MPESSLSQSLRVLALTLASLSACDRPQHDHAAPTTSDAHAGHAAAPESEIVVENIEPELIPEPPSAALEPTVAPAPSDASEPKPSEPKPSKLRKTIKSRTSEDVVIPEPKPVDPEPQPTEPEHPHHHHH